MRIAGNKFRICLFVTALTSFAFAQKVKVGYDKAADFSKYKTYSWAEPAMPPSRPVLYATVVSQVESDLSSKGFRRVDNNGDLVLTAAGGIGFAIAVSDAAPVPSTFSGPPPMNSGPMSGGQGGGQLMPAVADGTLELQFVDPNTKQLVWSGTVSQTLDIERKQKSLERAAKAVTKLLKDFPPKGNKK